MQQWRPAHADVKTCYNHGVTRSRRMRIALSNSSAKWGGVHVVTEVLARGLQSRGHDIVVFGYPGSRLEERMQGVAPFEAIGRGMDASPLGVMRAAAAMRRHRSQVVLAMMKKDVRRTVPAARLLGIPSVVRYANDRPLGGGFYDRLFFGMMPSRHVTNSEATRQTLLQSARWMAPESVEVIHNGIDPAQFGGVVPASLGLPEGALAVGFVGRLEKRKGLLDLALAWKSIVAHVPNAHLVIAGRGPNEHEAREILNELPRVHWLGYRADAAAVLSSLDIVAIPSHWEGFGLVAAEALLAGAVVVASNASSLPEIVTDGVHGVLVPVKDPEALANAIIELANDPEARRRYSAAGRERVRRDFSAEQMVDRFEGVLAAVLKAN